MEGKIIVGLPAYNEAQVLPKLFEKLELLRERFGDSLHVVVVNDGSTDRTQEIAREYALRHATARCLDHAENRGLGEAMKTLFAYVVEHFDDNDALVTLDADNTHNPGMIPGLVDKLTQERLDVVIASRFAAGGREIGLPVMRKLYSRGAKYFFKLFFPIPNISDYSSGFRCYRVGYLRKAIGLYRESFITSGGFACTAEIMARFSKIGVRADEYPLVLEYHLKEGASKMNVPKTVMGYVGLLAKVKTPREHLTMQGNDLG